MPRSLAKSACAKSASSRPARKPINPRAVTAAILARNEAHNLPALLRSLPDGLNALVIDDGSTDGTAEVARAHGARVIAHRLDSFVAARTFALSQIETPWTLMIDADERLDPVLRDAILDARGDCDGYEVCRTTFFAGKALRMWRGERLLRLFRTERVRLEAAPAAGGTSALHERWRCEGAVELLRGELIHSSYPTRAAYDEKFERYTSIEAGGVTASRSRLWRELVKAPLRFAWNAIRRGAILDGPAGWYVAWRSAQYRAVVQWKALQSR